MLTQTSTHFTRTLEQALTLSLEERIALVQAVVASFSTLSDENSTVDDLPLTEAEITELMTVDPLPPAEIVKLGLTGTWAHLNIPDGADWVNEQKRNRRERKKRKWQQP